MRYFIELSYDGSEFCGWQLQPNALTVQECLEETLSTLLKERVQVVGAGRTDSKVNAIGYVAHFDYDKVIDTSALGYKLNAILPRGIVVHSVREVDADLHARFSAKRREYTYFLHRTKDPFIENRSYFCSWDLDVDAMNEAAALLLGTHDFRCFEKSGSDNRTSICTVTEAFWAPYIPDHVSLMGFSPAASRPEVEAGGAPQYLYFRIAADRFLRNMVRAVVGSLLEVGRGRRSVEDFAALLLPPAYGAPCSTTSTPSIPGEPDRTSSRKSILPSSAESRHTAADGTPFRSLAGESVPGHALFLSRVDY
ncbi:MAG: tRNA pseudouridine(38-40) synthase TruA [Bacteroidales bacterium]|nr:tRNA pseudouridine(38-40) synthase TruA [Bacteroidales bacterium]